MPEILLKGVELAGDMRTVRHVRLRKAIEDGLAPAEMHRPSEPSEAVDPMLCDELAARLSRGHR